MVQIHPPLPITSDRKSQQTTRKQSPMSEYHEGDLNDPDRDIIRPKGTKKSSSFSYCKWAVGDWEARFYAWTPEHRKSMKHTLNQLMNDPCWYSAKPMKKDLKAIARVNKAKGGKKR
tara:strand:- start:1021 stop:1371 length:351 start_codon:yes stop_codon:yes gene_type:complete